MFDRDKIDELTKHLMEALPPSVLKIKDDLEKNFRAILHNAFAKMDLVTREEFDAQVAVLKKTREKLTALEKKIASLEKKPKHH